MLSFDNKRFYKFHCCPELIKLVDDIECSLNYYPKERDFTLVDLATGYRIKNESSSGWGVFYCPKCGKQFPPDLSDEWYNTLENEFGLDITYENKENPKLIPKEFLSNEWWIKRWDKFKNKKHLNEKEKEKKDLDEDKNLTEAEKKEKLKIYKKSLEIDLANLGEHCCITTQGIVENATIHEGCDGTYCKYSITYRQETRSFKLLNLTCHEYFFPQKEKRKRRILMTDIYFCSWCGKKLPKSLSKQWYEIVNKEFGVTNILDKKQLAKIPEEFMTDKWWKDRGL